MPGVEQVCKAVTESLDSRRYLLVHKRRVKSLQVADDSELAGPRGTCSVACVRGSPVIHISSEDRGQPPFDPVFFLWTHQSPQPFWPMCCGRDEGQEAHMAKRAVLRRLMPIACGAQSRSFMSRSFDPAMDRQKPGQALGPVAG